MWYGLVRITQNGTAIGTAIINSINRLKDSKSKSKVIILLTDGENNKGEIEPETAAQAAEALGIRIYSIGIGKDRAPYPFKDMFGNTRLREVDFKIAHQGFCPKIKTPSISPSFWHDTENLDNAPSPPTDISVLPLKVSLTQLELSQ
jgi:hypothetical protein